MEPSFINNGIYIHTLGLVTNARDWATLRTIRDATPTERTTYLTDTFMNALWGDDDAAALRYLEMVLRSETDTILEPILKVDKRFGEHTYTVIGGDIRNSTIALARTRRASVATELYLYIDKKARKTPSMRETRSALMKEIAAWCFETPDEDESKSLFNSFLRLPGLVKEHMKLALDALQEATGSNITLNRIKDRFSDLIAPSNYRRSDFNVNEAGQILTAAWTRNTVRGWNLCATPCAPQREGITWFAKALRIVSPLMSTSDAMLDLIAREAAVGAEIDREIYSLITSLKEAPAREHLPQDMPWWVAPIVTMKYAKHDMYAIDIGLTYRGYVPTRDNLSKTIFLYSGNTSRTRVNKGWLHDQFSLERLRILGWFSEQRAKNRRFVVSLHLFLYDEYAMEDVKGTAAEILFKREEIITS